MCPWLEPMQRIWLQPPASATPALEQAYLAQAGE
jgi:hypothetical protein